MSFITAFPALYTAQTAASGFTWTATVGAAANKACIVTEIERDEIIVSGGTAEKGSYELQILETDVPSIDEQQPVTLNRNGSAVSTGLTVLRYRRNNGILYVVATDPAADDV